MHTFWRAMACGALMMGVGLVTGGCEDTLSSNWEFVNGSSYRVYIAPNGQSWSPAMLNPGSSVEVNFNGEHIQYVYRPSNNVRAEKGSGRTIHFYNR